MGIKPRMEQFAAFKHYTSTLCSLLFLRFALTLYVLLSKALATLEGVLDNKSLSEEWGSKLRIEWQRQLFEAPYIVRSMLYVQYSRLDTLCPMPFARFPMALGPIPCAYALYARYPISSSIGFIV